MVTKIPHMHDFGGKVESTYIFMRLVLGLTFQTTLTPNKLRVVTRRSISNRLNWTAQAKTRGTYATARGIRLRLSCLRYIEHCPRRAKILNSVHLNGPFGFRLPALLNCCFTYGSVVLKNLPVILSV